MGLLPGQPPRVDGVGLTAENADGAGADEDRESAASNLPLRPVGYRLRRQRVRCMDDPEILQRVLEGLVNLT